MSSIKTFTGRGGRYRPGWIEWVCRDETFPGLAVSDGNGITARNTSI